MRAIKEFQKEALELLGQLGLKKLALTPAASLPFGQQRLVELARALGAKPRLMLLDEPSAGMNTREVQELSFLVQKIRSQMGITVLLIEHNMRMVMQISDWITVLHYGEKIAEGTPQTIREDPTVIEAYLGSKV